jgi:tetratricopeptide (TPR) repeat protein
METKTPRDYVRELDWATAIAAAGQGLENFKSSNGNPPPPPPAEPYICRGIARCFAFRREGDCKEAIEDLSMAIFLNGQSGASIDEALHYRAYAFYLEGNYERALEDGEKIAGQYIADELLGKILFSMGRYAEASEKFKSAIKHCLAKSPPELPTVGLLESWREARKRSLGA